MDQVLTQNIHDWCESGQTGSAIRLEPSTDLETKTQDRFFVRCLIGDNYSIICKKVKYYLIRR